MPKIRTIRTQHLFFVNVGYHKERREWEDCRDHGYVAAGLRRTLSKQLNNLPLKATIVAYVSRKTPSTRVGYKKNGYVGIGKVKATSVPLSDFQPPLTGQDLKGKKFVHDRGDNDKCEYLVAVQWFETVGKDDTKWQKGLYSNQNIVSQCHDDRKLKRTLHFLRQQFGIMIKLEKEGHAIPKKAAIKRLEQKRKGIRLIVTKHRPESSQFGYEYRTKAEVIIARKTEDKLLKDYEAWLEKKGRTLERIQYGNLCCDAFEQGRQNLIEAKSSTQREDIRMAVGELLDYEFLGNEKFGKLNKAILLPTKPDADIVRWLQHLKISIIWRKGKRFLENANGQFA